MYLKYTVTQPKIAVLSLGVTISRLMDDMNKTSLTVFAKAIGFNETLGGRSLPSG